MKSPDLEQAGSFNRREFLKAAGGSAMAAGMLANLSAIPLASDAPTSAVNPLDSKQKSSPNILLMVADDLGWGDPGFHGGAEHTPTLDRLAKESADLQRFYGYPVCSPSRAALLTGQMPRRLGITTIMGPRQSLPAGLSTFPRTLQSAGYQTFLAGKWHLGAQCPPQQNGFDHFYGFLGAEIDYFKHTGLRGEGLDWQRDGQPVEEAGYSTFLLADEAIRLMEKRDVERPFFLEVAFNAPHFPLSAPDEYLAKHRNLPPRRATYAAVVDALDASIGRILDALDKLGLRDNTLVLFCSDNGAGENGSNGPFSSGKGTVSEGGIRVPCLMRWPGQIEAGAICQQLMSVQDVYPTLAAAAGVPVKDEQKLDGKNLWAPLRSGNVQDRGAFVIAGTDFALFDGDWKLIETADGKRSLYQIVKDPGETTDLLAQHADIAQRLGTKLDEVKKDLPEVRARPRPGPGGPGAPAGPGPGRRGPSVGNTK
ncbi:MAG: sulfatase-like hydrolase/transferase [Candidatus Sumerlaeota bacterium]|nr:sulfatase-like hydrolase/transferase [Candidatus Sumerlaeota bacterium]